MPVSPKQQTMNSTTTPPLNTTSGEPWAAPTLLGPGTYTYTAEGTANDHGGCGFPTTWMATNSVVMHALACKPAWYTDDPPTINYHGPPTGTIVIAIPSAAFEGARGPAELAAQDWADGLGRTIVVQSGYTTCTSTDPRCIQLKNDHGTLTRRSCWVCVARHVFSFIRRRLGGFY
jgi:hypothetical protein